jgi:hypothetical protein
VGLFSNKPHKTYSKALFRQANCSSTLEHESENKDISTLSRSERKKRKSYETSAIAFPYFKVLSGRPEGSGKTEA